MKKMFLLELREGAPWFLLVFVLYTALLFVVPGEEAWLLPGEKLVSILVVVAPIAGGLIGFQLMARDDAQGVRDYLVHRGVSPAAIFMNRILQGLLAASLLATLPILVHLVSHAGFSLDRAPLRLARYGQYLLIQAGLFSGVAASVFAGALRGRLAVRVLHLLGVTVFVILIQAWFLSNLSGPKDMQVFTWLGAHAALLVAFLFAALGVFRLHQDPGRTVHPVLQVFLMIVMAVVCATLWNGIVHARERQTARDVLASYPKIVQRAGDEALLLARLEKGHYHVATSDHRMASEPISIERLLADPIDRLGHKIRNAPFLDGLFFPLDRGVFLNLDTGVVHHFVRDPGRDQVVRHQTFLDGDVPLQTPLRVSLVSGASFIGHPGATFVWVIPDGPRPSLTRVNLPRGGRFVSFEPYTQVTVLVDGSQAMFQVDEERSDLEHRRIVWKPADGPPIFSVPRVHREGKDLLHFAVTCEPLTGDALTHLYAPRTREERAGARWMAVLSTLRSPLILFGSFSDRDPNGWKSTYHGALLRAPLLVAGKRPTILIAALFLSVLLALCSHFILRSRISSFWVLLCASAIVFVGGIPAFLAVLLTSPQPCRVPNACPPSARKVFIERRPSSLLAAREV